MTALQDWLDSISENLEVVRASKEDKLVTASNAPDEPPAYWCEVCQKEKCAPLTDAKEAPLASEIHFYVLSYSVVIRPNNPLYEKQCVLGDESLATCRECAAEIEELAKP